MPIGEQATDEAQESPAAHPRELITVDPGSIRPNPENPRLYFIQESIERLAASIREQGVLVPITVYEDPATDEDGRETQYVLLDGERRWRAATLINHSLPALVIGRPQGVQNTLTMFNIHMQREEWSEIVTAWALEVVMQELGTTDAGELRRATGLSADRIRNMKIVLGYPRHYQEMVARGDLPFNFFVELNKAVLNRAAVRPEVVDGRDPTQLTDLFIDKYVNNALGDVVDLRKVGELIQATTDQGYVGTRAREELSHLLNNREATVSDAYAAGAAAGSELRVVLRDLRNLPGRVAHVATLDLAEQQKEELATALDNACEQIRALAAHLR